MIRLFLTEKPSVARDLGRVLGAERRVGQHLEGRGVWVAWCVGHLVEIAEPHEHDPRWRRWDPGLLPMLPPRLRLRPVARTRDLLGEVSRLLAHRDVSEVVNACDAGREGELIFRWVYELAGCRKPVRRLWLSSLTPAAIRAALERLRPEAELRPLEAAARCRAEADWLVGMNATRGLTARGDRLLSVGRVQTPTLALVVRREEEIERFVPEPYWRVVVEVEPCSPQDGSGERFQARWIAAEAARALKAGPRGAGPPRGGHPGAGPPAGHPDRIASAEVAAALAAKLQGAPGRVLWVETQRQELPPPQLHHLTSLQQEANRRFGLSAERTLAAAQALYERHKLITYPRTDSRWLTHDVAATLPAVLEALASGAGGWRCDAAAELLERGGPPRLGPRFVDDARVGDHHAIIPTPEPPDLSALSRDEARVHELVVRQTLGAFYPPAVWARARALLLAPAPGDEPEHLLAEGRTRLEAGWEAVNPPHRRPARPGARDEEQDEQAALPPLSEGQAVQCHEATVQARTTRPPPRYTEASLLGAMERAGRDLDEAELRRAMREAGLGTPATRAATIETLLAREYLGRDGRALVPLPAGRALIAALPVEALTSARLTGEWEARLQRIAAGEEPPEPFQADIRRFVGQVVGALRGLPRIALPAPPATSAPGEARGAAPAEGRRRVRSGRSSRARPERPPGGVPAPAAAPPPPAQEGPRCPACRVGQVVSGKRAWGCSRWREGCAFRVAFVQDGVTVPPEEAGRLFGRGETNLFARRGGARARLVLDPAHPGGVRWEPASGT
mgnify:CR=1 FL=1